MHQPLSHQLESNDQIDFQRSLTPTQEKLAPATEEPNKDFDLDKAFLHHTTPWSLEREDRDGKKKQKNVKQTPLFSYNAKKWQAPLCERPGSEEGREKIWSQQVNH